MYNSSAQLLHNPFIEMANQHPERPSVEVAGRRLTYRELHNLSNGVAGIISSLHQTDEVSSSLVAIVASRSVSGYAGILGALTSGRGYVPLNPVDPDSRKLWILQEMDCHVIIADEASLALLTPVLYAWKSSLTIILPESVEIVEIQRRWPNFKIFGQTDVLTTRHLANQSINEDSIAYILFTSGSTGAPKGVMVSHAASVAMLNAMSQRYGFSQTERFSQLADFTWDPSIVDMFLAWKHGACVCCPSAKTTLVPDKFLLEAEITVTHFVPTTIGRMQKMRLLKSGRYPRLRFVFVGGEPFPEVLAKAMQEAAPNATIVNIYGSQEYSIFSTYDWDSKKSPQECHNGYLPLGTFFRSSEMFLTSAEHQPEINPTEGELCVRGPQLFDGYWNLPEQTTMAHVQSLNGANLPFFRMGDHVRIVKTDASLIFLGRRDSQVKVAGIRIELGEVESALRDAAKATEAVAIGWPLTDIGAEGIVAFVAQTTLDPGVIRSLLVQRLPTYMIPREIRVLESFPCNANGKCDRKALLESLRTNKSSIA